MADLAISKYMNTQSQSLPLVWMPGPAQGGGGTAGTRDGVSWWNDGDRLLLMVNTVEDNSMSLVRVSADGDMLGFEDVNTGNDEFGYSPEDIDWWALVPLPEQPTA